VADGGVVMVRSDLCSLGLTICFMLTGKHAIDAGEPKRQSAILRRVRAGVEVELPGGSWVWRDC
jgi:hypothetical protein